MADWVSLFPLIFSRAKIALALAKGLWVQGRIYEFFEVGGGGGGQGKCEFSYWQAIQTSDGGYTPPPPIRHWTEWASAN